MLVNTHKPIDFTDAVHAALYYAIKYRVHRGTLPRKKYILTETARGDGITVLRLQEMRKRVYETCMAFH